MTNSSSRTVRVALEIREGEAEESILTMRIVEVDDYTTVLVDAAGFPLDDSGAEAISHLLRDVSDAIDEHLDVRSTETVVDVIESETHASVHRFNPQPRHQGGDRK